MSHWIHFTIGRSKERTRLSAYCEGRHERSVREVADVRVRDRRIEAFNRPRRGL